MKPPKKLIQATVRLMQMHHADKASFPAAQKIYDRLIKNIQKIEGMTGPIDPPVFEQISREAMRLGPITPMPGKDI